MSACGRTASVVKATALEILSEPVTLLVLLASLALAVLAPAFHYHQFGEPTRMARDAGFSAVFTGGTVLAVFATIRSIRREIETGTVEMALSHPISRGMFFVAKACGAFAACIVFTLTVFGVSLTSVAGAAVGGAIAERTGGIARIWGPCVAVGTAVIVLPMVAAAAANRFFRFRFVLASTITAACAAVASAAWAFSLDPAVLAPYFLAALPLVAFIAVFVSASAAFAVRFRANVAAVCSGVLFAAMVPFAGNYYLSDALSAGGSVSWIGAAVPFAAAIPAIAAFTLLGIGWTAERT